MRRWLATTVAVGLVLTAIPVAAAESSGPRSFTIAASGDVLIHDAVSRAARTTDGGYDFSPMYAPIEPWISSADLGICHLETTLSPTNRGIAGYPRFNAPHELADALAGAGYDLCSIAGNHAMDRGWTGVVETLDVLDAAGLGHDGTARSPEERLPSLIDVNGVTVAHMSYTYGLNGLRPPRDKPWAANVTDEEAIRSDATWAVEHGAEFVILSLHWGAEYQVLPTTSQSRLAASLLETSDVDLILGAHAHVIQPIDHIGDKVVVYGMGNQLSNQFSRWGYYATEDGVIVHITVTETDEGFVASDIAITPTMVEWRTYRILPADHTLTTGLSSDLANLAVSRDRTVERIRRLGDGVVTVTSPEWPEASCAGRPATIVGTNDADVLIGTPGPDVIAARGGDDIVWGRGGDDVICGGDGSDWIVPGPGESRVDPALGGKSPMTAPQPR